MANPKPGIYENVPTSEYETWECFHYSMVKHLERSALHLKEVMDKPPEPTSPMVLGSMVDTIICEPDEWNSLYSVVGYYEDSAPLQPMYWKVVERGRGENKKQERKLSKWNANSHTCQAEWKAVLDQGKMPIFKDQQEMAQRVAASVMQHPAAREIIERSKKQVSLVWKDDQTGILCKGRADFLSDQEIADLKTTRNASPKFKFQIEKFRYHVQGALYTDAMTALGQGVVLPYKIICVESEPPYASSAYILGEDSLLTGRKAYRKAMLRYKDAIETGKWPAYSICEEPIDIPPWAMDIDEPEQPQWLKGLGV